MAGARSFAAGFKAKATHTGAFVWADSQDADFSSTAVNQFNIRAAGGARFETAGAGLTVDGVKVLAPAGTPDAGKILMTDANGLPS